MAGVIDARQDPRIDMANAQAIGNILKAIGQAEYIRRQKQQLAEATQLLAKGVSPERTAGYVEDMPTNYSSGLSGIGQRIGGALGMGRRPLSGAEIVGHAMQPQIEQSKLDYYSGRAKHYGSRGETGKLPQGYQKDLATAIGAIEKGIDPAAIYRRLVLKYPEHAGDLKTRLMPNVRGGEQEAGEVPTFAEEQATTQQTTAQGGKLSEHIGNLQRIRQRAKEKNYAELRRRAEAEIAEIIKSKGGGDDDVQQFLAVLDSGDEELLNQYLEVLAAK